MIRKILATALALLSVEAMAQEKVRVHNGNDSFVTTIEYLTFDATDADSVISIVDLELQKATLEQHNKFLTDEKTKLMADTVALKSLNASLMADTAKLNAENSLLTADTAKLNGLIRTLTDEKKSIATDNDSLDSHISKLNDTIKNLATDNATLTAKMSSLEDQLKDNEFNLLFNDYDYVDLGLTSKTLWATCNVGAMNPEDFGDYYAWGDTDTKNFYGWRSYFDTKDNGNTFSIYNLNGGLTELNDTNDVAVQVFGGKWKMPTKEQQDELRAECHWEWTTSYNGKNTNGYLVFKKKAEDQYDAETDIHIFLPAAGGYWDENLNHTGVYGVYWSNTLNEYDAKYAYFLGLSPENVNGDISGRIYGFSVRPVFSADNSTNVIDQKSSLRNDIHYLKIAKAELENDTAVLKRQNLSLVADTAKLKADTAFLYEFLREYNLTDKYQHHTIRGWLNGYDFVDLGLPSKTLWATCNVGATNPEDFGNYYAWGDTITKDFYGWHGYFDIKDDDLSYFYKYSIVYSHLTELECINDIAGQKMGSKWRIPTNEQLQELLDECHWVYTSYNGVEGYLVYKKKAEGATYNVDTDAHIFLPLAGGCWDDIYRGSCGVYWSRSLCPSNNQYAFFLGLVQDLKKVDIGGRCYGFSIRPCAILDTDE